MKELKKENIIPDLFFSKEERINRNRFLELLGSFENCENFKLFKQTEMAVYKNSRNSFVEYYCFSGLDKARYISFKCLEIASEDIKVLINMIKSSEKFDFDVNIFCETLEVRLCDKRLTVTEQRSGKIIYKNLTLQMCSWWEKGYYPEKKMSIVTLSEIYIELSKKKFFPATLKSFGYLINEKLLLRYFAPVLLQALKTEYTFFRDVFNDIETLFNSAVPPIKFSEITDYHNVQDFLERKLNCKAPKSVNKAIFSNAYYVMKFLEKYKKRIAENEKQKMYAMFFSNWGWLNSLNSEQGRTDNVLKKYYETVCEGYDKSEHEDIIADYVDMLLGKLLREKGKIPLSINKIGGVIKRHDELILKAEIKGMGEIKISPNSKFNIERLPLPEQYERITTIERLYQETKLQHHCVFNYVHRINSDSCAIFSTVYQEKRYTIEIIRRKNKFAAAQIRGFANADCPKSLRSDFDKLITEINDSKKINSKKSK